MIRLLLSIVVAIALWPVDENNNTLGLPGSSEVAVDLFSLGYSVIEDAGTFCSRNAIACETASTIASNLALKFSTIIFEPNATDGAVEEGSEIQTQK